MATKAAEARGKRRAVKEMAQKGKIPPPSREAEKAQMAKALGHPTRLRILTVAHQRAISPGEFAKEHNMPIGTVWHHFEKLIEYDALKLVKKERVGGSTRHMYVGTKRAIYTESAWPLLPESVQAGLATATLEELVRVMSQSIKADKFIGRDDFTALWKEVVLDEVGWKALWEMLRLVSQKVLVLAEEAEARLEESGEEGFKAVVGLVSFEPAEPFEDEMQRTESMSPPSREAEKAQMAKALGHPTRLRILTVARQRAISASEFAKESGLKTSSVGYHFKKLAEYGALKLAREEKVGGSTRYMYVGTKCAIYAAPAFSESAQTGLLTTGLDGLVRVMSRSIETGTFIRRDDFTFNWEEVILDEIAWKTLRSILRLLWKKIPTLAKESKARLEDSNDGKLQSIIGLIAFEAAEPKRPKPARRKKRAKKRA